MRQTVEPLRKPPARIWLAAFAFWLIAAGLGIGGSTVRHARQMEQDFLAQSQALYEVVRQRLEQNEAVLAGIEALFRTFPNLQFDGIRDYARAMLARYPHIYTVGLQPRIDLAGVPAFEAWADKAIQPGYRIRDFGLENERTWRIAAPRPIYYPVTFMEPPIPEASPVMGFDVYSDRKLHEAIDASIASGRFAASVPFPLVEGGRGYVFFKALPSADGRQAENLVSLLINASIFLRPEEFPPENIGVTLAYGGHALDDPSGQLFSRPAQKPDTPRFAALFPRFSMLRTFDSNQQPFVLSTQQSPGAAIFDAAEVAAVLIGVTVLSLLLLLIYAMREQRLTQERAAAHRLQQERAKAHVTLAAIADGVIRIDRHYRIDYANESATRILHRPAARLLGQDVRDAVPLNVALARTADEHPAVRCLTCGQSVELPDDTTLIGADGREILIEGAVSPLFDEPGALGGAVLAFRNIGPMRQRALAALAASETRVRRHQTELAHVARLNTMGEMAAGIAHELNQPLNAILNYNQASLRLLADETPDFAEIRRAMTQAAAQARRAGEIIRVLRAFIGKGGRVFHPVRIEQIVRNALILAESEIDDQEARVEQRLAEGLPEILADSIQIEQVILNLLRNSLEAMQTLPGAERRIEIGARLAGRELIVGVRDRGPGIAPGLLDRIFHPFQTSKPQGMGLGLAICHSIIERHGGRIRAGNAAGGGAVLEFTLPIHTPP